MNDGITVTVGKSLHWHVTTICILFNDKVATELYSVGIQKQSYINLRSSFGTLGEGVGGGGRHGRYCIFEEQYGIRKNTSVSLNTFCTYTHIVLKETNETTIIILCHQVSFEVSQKVKTIVNTSTCTHSSVLVHSVNMAVWELTSRTHGHH